MKSPSLGAAATMCAIAVLLWVGVFWFANKIASDAALSASAIAQAKRLIIKREADNATASLITETASGRAQLEAIINKNALSLADAITRAGTDAGVPVIVANVTQGPGPKMKTGAVLNPTAVTFVIKASGPFQKIFTAAMLLSELPSASSIDHLQFNAEEGGLWEMNADVHVITGNLISS